jgi:hypothetical protein
MRFLLNCWHTGKHIVVYLLNFDTGKKQLVVEPNINNMKKLIFICLLIFNGQAFAQSVPAKKHKKMCIEIVDLKPTYSLKDRVVLKVTNNSSKSLWYVIANNTFDGKDWFCSILDIKHPFTYTEKYDELSPGKSKVTSVIMDSITDTPHKKTRKVFGKMRFLLNYRSAMNQPDDTTTTKVFLLVQ